MLHKKKKVIGIVLLVVAMLAGCAGTAKVEQSTSQVWHGGAAGSGGGKNYKVTVSKSASLEVMIDKVWLGDRERGWLPEYRVMYKGAPNGMRNHLAPKGVTTFTLEFAEVHPGQPNPRGEGRPVAVKPFDNPPSDLPEGFDKGAVIYCHVGNNAVVWTVSDFVVLEPLNYP
jgi:hypothetical protein